MEEKALSANANNNPTAIKLLVAFFLLVPGSLMGKTFYEGLPSVMQRDQALKKTLQQAIHRQERAGSKNPVTLKSLRFESAYKGKQVTVSYDFKGQTKQRVYMIYKPVFGHWFITREVKEK